MSRWDTLDERIANATTWNVGDFVAWTMSHGSDYRFHAVVVKTYKRKVKIHFAKPMWYGREFEQAEKVVEPWLLVPYSPDHPEMRFDGLCCAPGCLKLVVESELPQRERVFCPQHDQEVK
jgi:hypothetical protein